MNFDHDRFKENCKSAGGKYSMIENNRGAKTASCDFKRNGRKRNLKIHEEPYSTHIRVITEKGAMEITKPVNTYVDTPSENQIKKAKERNITLRKQLVIESKKDKPLEEIKVSGEPAHTETTLNKLKKKVTNNGR